MVATPISAAGASPRKTVAVTMVRKLDEIDIRLRRGVHRRQVADDRRGQQEQQPRSQFESPLRPDGDRERRGQRGQLEVSTTVLVVRPSLDLLG